MVYSWCTHGVFMMFYYQFQLLYSSFICLYMDISMMWWYVSLSYQSCLFLTGVCLWTYFDVCSNGCDHENVWLGWPVCSVYIIADIAEVTKFDKTKLKKTATAEKNTLPTKEGNNWKVLVIFSLYLVNYSWDGHSTCIHEALCSVHILVKLCGILITLLY